MLGVSNRGVAIATLAFSLALIAYEGAAQAGAETVTWDDLLPKQEVPFDDPFEELR